jgi:hypothetical protein
VHGSKDRAKDASPESHATISRACVGCIRFVAHADDVPLLGDLLDIRCHRRVICSGGCRYRMTDRPRPSFRQHPAKGTAFQKIRMPFTVTTHEGIDLPRRDCSLRPSCRLSRSRRPHFVPKLGTVLFVGHCKCLGVVTHAPGLFVFESANAFVTRWNCHAWD